MNAPKDHTPLRIPTLETERLTLRAPQDADFDGLCRFFATDHAKFVGGPLTAERTWRVLAQEVGHWQLRGFGRWSVVEKGTGQWVGIVGLWHPVGFPENELGWDLLPEATGKGYATEAATAARRHAYETLHWSTLISLVADGNEASAAVAKRLGARPDGRFVHEQFGPANIWRHPDPATLEAGG